MSFKSVLYSLLTVLFTAGYMHSVQAAAASTKGKHIHWMTNYEKAVEISKSTHRPSILFFTGSDWCGWCNKLEKEILETSDFLEAAGDKLIYVKLDFPMKTKLNPDTAAQNEQLQKRFSVRSYPTIVLLDPDQQPIGVTGYRAGGGKQYALHLIKMVNEYAAYKQQIRRVSSNNFSGKELKRLYQKAHELGLKDDQNLLIRIGMESDLAHFFQTERYRFLVSEGQLNTDEAVALKQRLFAIDPDNKNLTHYQIAVIDFESCCEEMEKNNMTPDQAVKPLTSYIKNFGTGDKENLWRLNMVISQTYLEQNRLNDALKYAKKSHSSAPASIQSDISNAIANIQKQIEIEATSN